MLSMINILSQDILYFYSSHQVAPVPYTDSNDPVLTDRSGRWWLLWSPSPGCDWYLEVFGLDHKLSVFQEVDEDIDRSIQVGQEAGEGAGAF